MNYSLPITYEDGYIPKGNRNVRNCISYGEVNISITETDRGEAPVVHVAGNTDLPDESSRREKEFTGTFRSEGNFVSEIVEYQGTYYSSVFPVDEFPGRVGEETALNPFYSRFQYFGDSQPSLKLVPGGCRIEQYGDTPDRSDIEAGNTEVRKWVDNYERAASFVKNRAQDLLIVDGKVHVKVSEPVLAIVYAGNNNLPCLIVAEALKNNHFGGDHGNNDHDTLRFGLDEIDLARSFLKLDNGVDCTDIKHVSPESVLFRNDDRRLFSAAETVIRKTKKFVGSTNRDFAKAWNRLHLALRPGALSTQVLDEIQNFLDCCDTYGEDIFRNATNKEVGENFWESTRNGPDNPMRGIQFLRLTMDFWNKRVSSNLDWTENSIGMAPFVEGDLVTREVTNARELFRTIDTLGADVGLANSVLSGNGHAIVISDRKGPVSLARVEPGADSAFEVKELYSRREKYVEASRQLIETRLAEESETLALSLPAFG